MNMNASGAAGAAGAAVPPPTMNRPAYPVAAPVSGAMRAYPQQPPPQQPVASDADTKQVTTEQIQEMLDENSRLIVDVITLNNQIKHGKGTAQLSEFTDKLDKKRKQLNANLMTLAKWADESSEQPPPRQVSPSPQQLQQQQQLYAQVQQQQMQQMRYPRGMVMNPMAGAQLAPGQAPMQLSAAQIQAQRYAHAQAYAQYQARLNQMGGAAAAGVHPQYAQMAPAAVAPQQPRYHVNPMAYNPAAMQQQQQHAMAMGPQPQLYDDGSGQMAYQPQQQSQQSQPQSQQPQQQWAPN